MTRRREVGIRLALGARSWRLRAWLLWPGILLTAYGIAAGIVASIPAARVLESQLFGLRSDSLLERAIAAVLLMTAGVAAASVPAVRIVGQRALTALRYE